MNFDPISPGPDSHVAVSPALNDYEETVRSTNPLRAAFTFIRSVVPIYRYFADRFDDIRN